MSTPTLPRPAPPTAPAPRRSLRDPGHPQRPGLQRLWRGGPDDPPWARPALLVLLAGTALLYLWNLAASGYANSYYAAAVQAGTQSWKAFFFGSLDAGSIITVDKTPASLWVMELSGRIFGFSSWSMLAPQALEGVAAVALLAAAVRRMSGHAAGLLAGAAFALTPVVTLMFRFNNPDALLTLLLVGGAYCTVRALERAQQRAGTRWLVLAGVCLGLGFLTKMLQAFLILPGLALAFLLFAAGPVLRRLGQLVLAGIAVVVSAGWWVAIVQLWPASSRPYIGGSTTNSVLELALGYNGLSRILGNSAGAGGAPGGGGPGGGGPGGGFGGGAANTGFGGASGLFRMFGDSFGTEVSWLLPAALIGLLAALWIGRRAPRTDLTRAGLVLWALWLAVTALVFSFMDGTVHPYYAIALAPAIAAAVGISAGELWRHRDALLARAGLAAMLLATGGWSYQLLARTPSWYPQLRYLLVALAVLAAAAVLPPGMRRARVAAAAAVLALVAGLGGSAAYAVQTAALPHSGSIPTSGPQSSGMGSGAGRFANGPGGPGSGQGAAGSGSTDSALVALLAKAGTTWSAATQGAQSAAGLELASGTSVIGIGGFTGSDPAPSLAQFQALVRSGAVRYYVVTGGMGGGMGGGDRSTGQILSWVQQHYTASTVGGATVYDLTDG